MYRYIDYIDNHKDALLGTISINNYYKSGFIDNIKFPTKKHLNRAFHGDKVYYVVKDNVGQIINVKREKYGLICGVLDIKSLTTYGINKKGHHYYIFKPNNKKYPNFYVAFNLKNKLNKEYKIKNKNIYCCIEFNCWENTKCPRGNLVKIIGLIGDINAEYDYILHRHNMFFSKNRIKKRDINNIIYPKLKDTDIISIDPPNCTDIDDALHCKKTDDGYEVGVHIADVSSYVKENDDIDIEAKKRLYSVYKPTERIDMLPSWLSTEICSLHPKQEKRVVSLMMKFNESMDLTSYEFKRHIIISKKAYTYDQVDKLLNKNKNYYNLLILMKLANYIHKKYDITINSEGSHKLVEVFMVFANMLTGKYLIEKKKYPLIRVHTIKDFNKDDINSLTNNSLKHYITILNMNKALYTIYDGQNSCHSGLNINYYTHMTSPIRRYADILVHRILFDDIQIDKNICMRMNETNRMITRCSRDFEKIQIINNLEDKIYDAYIIKLNNNYITIFLPEFNMSTNFRLFNKRLLDIIEYKQDNNKLQVIDVHTNNKITLELFEKVSVRLISYMQEERLDNKLVVRIIKMEYFYNKN
jgi:exosome complex exonuclease DIS3/RRP44